MREWWSFHQEFSVRCDEFKSPAITWDMIIFSEYVVLQLLLVQSHFRTKSQSIACDFKRDMNRVIDSPSPWRIEKNFWRYTSGWIVFTATDLMWARSVISVELFSASGPTKLKSISLTVESQVDLNSFRISCSSVNLVISLYRVQASVNMIHFLSVQPAVIVGRLGFEQRFWLIGTFGLVEVGRSYDISLVICSCIVICCCCIWRIIDIARL